MRTRLGQNFLIDKNITKKIILVFLTSVFFSILFIKTHRISIVKIGNAKVINSRKNIVFVFEDFFHPELQKLRKQEKLDELVKDSKTEFEKILILKNWVNKQWEQSTPHPYPPFNANVILKQIRAKKTGGWCGQYGAVFAQACMSFGIPARYFDIMPKGKGGHFVTEVYSKDYKKWILMDPTINIYYEKDSIPLSVMELHELGFSDKKKDVYSVSFSSKNMADLNYFYSFILWLRNNHLSYPLDASSKIEIKDNTKVSLSFKFSERKMWYIDKHSMLKMKTEPKTSVLSSDRKDFCWKPDIVVIKVLKKNWIKKTVFLDFSGLCKNYRKFLVSYDGRKNWYSTGSKYVWQLKNGFNMLEVTAPDRNGLKERYSHIIVKLGNR